MKNTIIETTGKPHLIFFGRRNGRSTTPAISARIPATSVASSERLLINGALVLQSKAAMSASTVPSVWLFRFFRVASIVPSEDSFELMHSALGKLRANARSLFLMRF